eukprot:TRINITY_DN20252_c0_g1_i1.p1 TRINITY_DN20252_c0_g1~~TRINITY_DN20252_c0_g1_i1.p1  ORF type:complete len:4669 (+),score=1741.83 TRINITY_DN20252_c0_g1_i1:139-14145(+)
MSKSVVDSLPALRQYFQAHVTHHLGIDVETFYNAESRADPFELAITDFIKEGGAKKLLWYTVREKQLLTAMQQEQRMENEDTLSNAQSSMSTASAGGASVMSKIEDADSEDSQSTTSSAAAQQRVIVSTDQLHTLDQYNCVYFVRDSENDPSPITEKDIHYRVFCGRFVESEPGCVTNQTLDLIGSLTNIIGRFMLPMLRSKGDFGDLTTLRPNVPAAKVDEVVHFVSKTERFRESLTSVVESLKATLTLSKPTRRFCIEFNLKSFAKAGMKREVVECYEATVYNWIRQIEKVLAVGFEDPVAAQEGTTGTGEYASFDDDDGPDVELDLWKKRTTLLNHLTDALQTRPNRTILGVLTAAGPRAQQVMTEWKNVELALTEAANEAKDNMKYLSTLEQFAEPLFADEPKMASIKLCIPAIINMIKMVHTISKYYNTCERLTGLFVKTTNQIIKACRRYLERNGSVWEQPPDIAIEDLRACVELKDIYLFHYRQTKGEMAANTPGPQFNFSEASIFGKFDLFAARVGKLVDVMHVTRQFDRLMMANIEHIQPLCQSYQNILSDLRSQAGDYLEARRRDFDSTYQDYKFRVQELSTELVVFLNNRFLTVTNTSKALHLLSRFRVVLNNTHITRLLEEKHSSIFMSYGRDLEAIKAVYEKHKESPPCHRNTPPVSGAISWVRQLQRKIEGPMKIFQETPQLFNHSRDAKRIIRTYNKVAKTFVTYETRWYEAWANRVVDDAKEGLQATLLVCDKATGRVHVNFDRSIRQLGREVYCLLRLGFPIPHEARSIHSQKNALLYYSEELHYILDRYYKLIDRIDKLHCGLIIPHINRLNVIINPGLVQLTWTSLNISLFIKSVDEALTQVETIVDRVNGILKHRVEACNEAIRKISFICVAQDLSQPNVTHSPKTITEMIALQKKHSKHVSNRINVLNCEVASATREIVSITTHGYTAAEMSSVMGAITELYTTFEHDVFTAILQAMQQSVLYLKTRVTGPTARGNLGSSVFLHPAPAMFHAELVIKSRSVDFSPSLEELQRCVNQMARSILETARGIFRWKQDGKLPHTYDVVEYQSNVLRGERHGRAQKDAHQSMEGGGGDDSGSGSECDFPKTKLKSLFLRIGKNRKMTKVFLQLTGAVSSLQGQLSAFLQQFSYYDTLLKGNRANALENFNTSSHSFEAYEENIQLYDNLERDVHLMPTSHSIGCLVIDLTKIKHFLANEAAAWKMGFGVSLNLRVKNEMDALIHSMEVIQTKLNRKVHDLSDVNSIMKVITQLRFDESEIDMKLQPIVGAYDVLYKYNVKVTKEEQDQVDRIGFQWNDLVSQSRTIMDQLQQVGPRFKMVLLNDVVAFQQQVHTFKQDYDRNGPMTEHIEPRLAVERLKVFEKQFVECKRKLSEYAMGEQLFGLPITRYPEVEQIERELSLLSKLYDLYTEVLAKKAVLEELPWIEVDVAKMRTVIKAYHERVKKMPSGQRDWQGYKELRLIIDELLDTTPILELLLQKWVFPRHWAQLSSVTGVQLNPKLPEFRLKHVLEARLINLKSEVEEITTAARKEFEIEVKLSRIKDEWSQREVTLAPFKNRGYLVLKSDSTSELISRVEEAQTILTSLLSSRFNEPFKKDIMLWISKLTTTQERIGEWLEVQHLWIYMEAVFSGSGDIGKEMPHEVKRFGNIDRQWTKIMRSAAETPNALKLCVQSDMLSNLLPHLRLYLDMCKKSLSGYLCSKRNVQPRFFFVSNSQLLEILGQASNPQTVQSHLPSITNAMCDLMFDQDRNILGFHSKDGETVRFEAPISTDRDVVEWIQSILDESASTLRSKTKRMLRDLSVFDSSTTSGIRTFCEKYPAQLVLLSLRILWTSDCEYAFTMQRTEKGSVSVKVRKHKHLQEQLVVMVREPELTQRERLLYEALIMTEIHQFDFMIAMQRQLKKVRSIGDFEWVRQTRYYWRSERDTAMATTIDVDFDYGFEYQSQGEKMVITDVTDRMYISVAQALGAGYGGCAHGPAGTGKTETLKDMGRSFGRYVVVMNCSEQMSAHYMASLFKGIATSGCWAMFDEIDRVAPVVLSVVASQVACVLHGKRNRQAEIMFPDGMSVKLSPFSSVLATTSTNERHHGRHGLPASFKTMFRPVALVVPDRQAIVRVRLAACGFLDHVTLSRKFNALYQVSEDHLGRNSDYDFGLRSVLAVLRKAGALLRQQPLRAHTGGKISTDDAVLERGVLIAALRSTNFSKLSETDAAMFNDLLSDVFPGHESNATVDAELRAAVPREIAAHDLTPAPEWLANIYQTYEQIQARSGVCLLGPTASGKSSALNVLESVISSLHTPVRVNRLNPKTLSVNELYGQHDMNTGDWSDGIFTAMWRRVIKRNLRAWIWLDGPMDSMWVESLNTVLDDTKVLTLPSNERLPLSPDLTLVFEVDSLQHASPSTVSRLGMVYMGAKSLQWPSFLSAWCTKHRQVLKTNAPGVMDLYHKLVPGMLAFARRNFTEVVPVNDLVVVMNMLKLNEGLFDTTNRATGQTQALVFQRLSIYAFAWGVGGLFEDADRQRVHQYLVGQKADVPEGQSIFDSYIDTATGAWLAWKVEPEHYDALFAAKPSELHRQYVPTPQSLKLQHVLRAATKQIPSHPNQARNALVVGRSGVGKTSLVLNHLNAAAKEGPCHHRSVQLSSVATPASVQAAIISFVDKISGSNWGPPPGTLLHVFIDDISMPSKDQYGGQPPLEVVRQLLDAGYFVNRTRLETAEKLLLACTHIVAAMDHPSARSDIPARLKQHFFIVNATLPTPETLDHLCTTLLSAHFTKDRFTPAVLNAVPLLVAASRDLWTAVRERLISTPITEHYIFSLRDITRVALGMCRAAPEKVTNLRDLVLLHEAEVRRVYTDKLLPDDERWVTERYAAAIGELFGVEMKQGLQQDTQLWTYYASGEQMVDEEVILPPGAYEMVPHETLLPVMQRQMEHYNSATPSKKAKPTLLTFAVQHLMRVARVLITPRASMLLIGPVGSGKRSICRLASYITRCVLFELPCTPAYTAASLMEDLREFQKTCSMGSAVSILASEASMQDSAIADILHVLASGGDVVGLHQKDELELLFADLVPYMDGTDHSPEAVQQFFSERVHDNLHLLLCASSHTSDTFRQKLRAFPSLAKECYVDMYHPWSLESLTDAAQAALADIPQGDAEATKTKHLSQLLGRHVARMHTLMQGMAGRYAREQRLTVFVAPGDFFEHLKVLKEKFCTMLDDLENRGVQLQTCLRTLTEAHEDLTNIRTSLSEKQSTLDKSSHALSGMEEEIAYRAEYVAGQATKVEGTRAELADEAAAIDEERAEADNQLAAAAPAQLAAEEALLSVKQDDLNILRRLTTVPPIVRRIFDTMLLVLHMPLEAPAGWENDSAGNRVLRASWQQGKALAMDPRFLPTLQEFPRHSINDEDCELLAPYLAMDEFNLDRAKTTSGSVAGLCTWVRMMTTYHQFSKATAPRRAQLAVAEAKLYKSRQALQRVEQELAQREGELAECREKYQKASDERMALQQEVESTRRRVATAETLLVGLDGEGELWKQRLTTTVDSIRALAGNVARITTLLIYCPPFNQRYRHHIMQDCEDDLRDLGIPFSQGDIGPLLMDESTQRARVLEGLPPDAHSMQNASIVNHTNKRVLLLDPQGQGVRWVVNAQEAKGMLVVNIKSSDFTKVLKSGMREGKTVVIDGVNESLPASLQPLVDGVYMKATLLDGSRVQLCSVDGVETEVSEGFNAIFVCPLLRPKLHHEMFTKLCVVDFGMTKTGMTEQLLRTTVRHEKPSLEEDRVMLLDDILNYERVLAECNDRLLSRLSLEDGNRLLADGPTIEALQLTKEKANEFEDKLKECKEATEKVKQAREEYRPIALRGAILYHTVAQMVHVQHMYHVSLDQFMELFRAALKSAPANPYPPKRVANVVSYQTHHIFHFMKRGFYSQDKHVFALLLALEVQQDLGLVSQAEVDLLRHHPMLQTPKADPTRPLWCRPEEWAAVGLLDSEGSKDCNAMASLKASIKASNVAWMEWHALARPEETPLPHCDDRLSLFQKLLVINALRQDRIGVATANFAHAVLGPDVLRCDAMDYTFLSTATPRNPVLCLLSPGVDPNNMIDALSRKDRVTVAHVSMGEGQEAVAMRAVQQTLQEGGWVVLHNCHLSIPFVSQLADYLRSSKVEPAPNSVVWMTSLPCPDFPISALNRSVKIALEAPTGVKAGLSHAFNSITQDQLDSIHQREWRILLYTLCFLHTAVTERNRYGTVGWSTPYDFTTHDLQVSTAFLYNYLYTDIKKGVAWPTIQYMLCGVLYGGCITDPHDHRILSAYGERWFLDEVFDTHGGGFSFAHGYRVADYLTVREYHEHIAQLPKEEKAETIGLHASAARELNETTSRRIIDSMCLIGVTAPAVPNPSAVYPALMKVCKDVPAVLTPILGATVDEGIRLQGNSPLALLLAREIESMRALARFINESCALLKGLCLGTTVPTDELEAIQASLSVRAVPEAWARRSWRARGLDAWMQGAALRLEQLELWVAKGPPKVFHLTAFFFPSALLTTLKQEFLRPHLPQWSLDMVEMRAELTRHSSPEAVVATSSLAEEGCHYVYGLSLIAASWDRTSNMITDPPHSSDVYNALPVAKLLCSVSQATDTKHFLCPVFADPSRCQSKFIFNLTIKTDQPLDTWILRGAVAVLSTE